MASLQELRANKKGPINKSLFNFLENLLVFRTLEKPAVPPESRVKFRISRQTGDPGICLLIHIDEQLFPVIEEGPRPDYLALYLHGDGCICTIIEMKSMSEKKLKHGLEQIKALADKLRQEFEEHLPRRFRMDIQGIMVCQINAQVPNVLIEKMAAGGLTIFPAPCNSGAELYPYISRKNKLTERFENKTRSPAPPGALEEILSRKSLRRRLPDELTSQRAGEGAGQGLHINYALSDGGEYAALITRGNKCVFVVSEQGDQHLHRLQADIAANGLQQKFDVEPMPQADPAEEL